MRSNKGRQGKTGAKRFYRPNGDNVKLPHELWRAPLWTTANQHTLAKAAERDCVRRNMPKLREMRIITAAPVSLGRWGLCCL